MALSVDFTIAVSGDSVAKHNRFIKHLISLSEAISFTQAIVEGFGHIPNSVRRIHNDGLSNLADPVGGGEKHITHAWA